MHMKAKDELDTEITMSNINLELIKKYNVQGPRYTSYPTAVQFKETTRKDCISFLEYLEEHNSKARDVSLYFHIPFCFSLCWYCGCTKVITKDQDRGDLYLDYLEKEMNVIAGLVNKGSKVIQIHFGGGTPTFLKPGQLLRLGDLIQSKFNISNHVEFSVEIDPRRCTRAHIMALKSMGCNRASLGVQDTNEEVQKAIHRVQPFSKTKQVCEWLHSEGIHSINFDLIYGLPRQTIDTFRQSMDDVISLRPDRLAVYSYAHIPKLMPAQKLLNVDEMPTTHEKLSMFKKGISHFTKNGYRYIGMDHFSRENEELSQAMDDKTLQRNFQGYSTHSGADLYAFGMSGISNVGDFYWQNSKDLTDYYGSLDNKQLPITKLLKLSEDDKIRKDVIMQIMCQMGVNFREVEKKWGIVFEEYFNKSFKKMDQLIADGFIKIEEEGDEHN